MKIERPVSKQPIPPHAKKVFSGVIYDVHQWEQKMYDGTVATFEKLSRSDSAVVFALLPDGKILLAEQEQPGKEAFISAIGGRINSGEEPLEAAKRELLEETGYGADEFVLWRAEHVTSKIDWVIYVFIAKGLRKVAEPSLDGGEKITLRPVSFEELLSISFHERFAEKEVVPELKEAYFDERKRDALRTLFSLI